MRFVYFSIVCLVLAGCFFVGYQIAQQAEVAPITIEEAPPSVPEPDSELAEGEPAEVPVDEALESTEAVETPQPTGPTEADWTRYELEARAAKGVVDLTDQQGRTIRCLILEAGPDSIKVRRQIDFTVVEIPVEMLNDEDRAFAEFLWERHQTENPRAAGSMGSERVPSDDEDEEISAELFEEIFGR